MPTTETTNLLDQISLALTDLRNAGHRHVNIRWENEDGSPHAYHVRPQETQHPHRLAISDGDEKVTIEHQETDTYPINHHPNWAIGRLITPQGITATYHTTPVIHSHDSEATPSNEIALDSPDRRLVKAREIVADGHTVMVVLLDSNKSNGKIEAVLADGRNRAHEPTVTTSTMGIRWMTTETRNPGAKVQNHACRVVITATDHASDLEALSPKAIIDVEQATLAMLHEVMTEQQTRGYAWTGENGILAGLYRKYGPEMGVTMPEAPETNSPFNQGHMLTPSNAVNITGPIAFNAQQALQDPRNSNLDIVVVTGRHDSLPQMRVAATKITLPGGATVTIPAESRDGAPRITETLLGPALGIVHTMQVEQPDGQQRQLEIVAPLYADQEAGHRVLVYEDGAVSEEDLSYHAVEPPPPAMEWGQRHNYRSAGEFYDGLTEIRQAITAKAATGDLAGARELAAKITGQIDQYLNDGLQ